MEVTTHRGEGKLQQVIEIGPHRVLTDAKDSEVLVFDLPY